MPDGDYLEVRKRQGWADVHDSVKLIFKDRVVTGMITAVAEVRLGWFTQMQLSNYTIQIAPVSEDGHTVCTCRPSVEDSDASPLCGAIHADMADLNDVDLYFTWGDTDG